MGKACGVETLGATVGRELYREQVEADWRKSTTEQWEFEDVGKEKVWRRQQEKLRACCNSDAGKGPSFKLAD